MPRFRSYRSSTRARRAAPYDPMARIRAAAARVIQSAYRRRLARTRPAGRVYSMASRRTIGYRRIRR